jgi:hypothetical protein
MFAAVSSHLALAFLCPFLVWLWKLREQTLDKGMEFLIVVCVFFSFLRFWLIRRNCWCRRTCLYGGRYKTFATELEESSFLRRPLENLTRPFPLLFSYSQRAKGSF